MRLLLPAAIALLTPSAVTAESVLFVGNSFTFGALSPVMTWHADSVSDLNGEGVGGVPALFKRFTEESGLHYEVSVETAPGRSLRWHWENKRQLLDRRWDQVVMQEYSTLDPDRPGDATQLIAASAELAGLFRARNLETRIALVATWSRPDQTYQPGGHWSGKPIEQMALDIRRADDRAARGAGIGKVVPVGEAFNCAIASGVADANPYDGISRGRIDLWADDHYHASTAGYYLEALTIFTKITGRDPRALGNDESAARELGMPAVLAGRLQRIAFEVGIRQRCAASH